MPARTDPDKMTRGGIHLSAGAQEQAQFGYVYAVGPGNRVDGKFIEMTLQRGDKVLFHPFQGHRITMEGVEFLVLREADVMAVVE